MTDEKSQPHAEIPESDDRSRAMRRIRDAWRDTVGNYATDEGETKTLFERLVHFGAISREEATRLMSDTRARIEQNRDELDERVEQSIKSALKALTIPSSEEVARLNQSLDRLEARLIELEEKRADKRA